MSASLITFNDIVIPVIGICILVPLIAATYFEPRRDYSRRVYIAMLYSCLCLLAMEWLQLTFATAPNAAGRLPLQIVMFVFYAFLAVLCCCWTLYAYYWFNGVPPSAKNAAVLSIGPAAELAALLANLFGGFIYYVGADGSYYRGSAFPLYISLSYAYLIAAISITAISAVKNRRGNGRQNILLFLLFFLFPVLGPIVQYMFSELSLMGISEAVALLIVYVAVQQKTTAQYAVEKARYEDEYRAYEKSLERLLTVGPDALRVFRLNLTQNSFTGEQGTENGVWSDSDPHSVDELFDVFAAAIRDASEAQRFRAVFDRQTLLRDFSENMKKTSLEYHRRVENGEIHLVRVSVNLLQSPVSGDVEAITYSVDIDRQEKDEKVISAITNREYDYIALIDSETKKLHYWYSKPLLDIPFLYVKTDYDSAMKSSSALLKPLDKSTGEALTFLAVTDALSRQDEYTFVFECLTMDGAKLQKKAAYLYLDERKTEILFILSDITEETRVDRERSAALQTALLEARRADILKSEFLSNVSHDMRTPLNAVLGYTRIAANAGDLAEVKACVEKIEHAGNILLSLVNDTLDLSKIETGSIVLRPAPVYCREVTEKVMAAVVPAAYKKHIRLNFDDSRASGISILADALRLQELLVHLLSNAVKFTPDFGEVSFSVEAEEVTDRAVRARITVSDTGSGMQPEFLPKMYEPFAQEHPGGDDSGSGLGLAIVKKLVDMMGGSIAVESAPGRGTSFTLVFTFDRADAAAKPLLPELIDSRLSGKKILLVEDNEMNTEIARSILESKGMTVRCAENGRLACDVFAGSQAGDYDAILMDIRMPVMDGREAARTIRSMQRPDAGDIPILALSADAFDDDVQASLAAGMNAHLPKPIDPQQLYETLAKHFSAAG